MPHKCPKPSLVAFPITLGALVLLEAVPGGSPSAAYAQSQPLETVVVTARRTAENLRDVPATVNVLTESTIEDAGVETLEDLVNLTPGVTVVTNTAEPGDTQEYSRHQRCAGW
jgi:iron complex outermembrane receptor protein